MFEDKDFNKTGFNAESTMMKESYDEMLDEMGAAVLKGYDASRLLRETDPIAYQVGMNDYESSLLSDIQSGYTENSKIFDEDENLTTYGENVLKEMYDDMLDEMGVEVMLNNYDASRLLEEAYPIAYQVGLNDYESSMESDMEDDMSPYEKIARRNVGMAESSLTRLTSDHPKFDPQKADRNKDGKISSWERTVGNEVAKSMGAETDEKKLVELLVEYNLPGDPEYIYDLLEGANMKIIKMKDYYDAESFDADSFQDDTHSVLIHGEKDGKTVSKGHQLGITEKDGFTPNTITTFDYNPQGGLSTSRLLNFDGRVETIDPNFVNRYHRSQRMRAETFEAPKPRLSKKQQETLDYIKEATMRTGRAYITGETYNMRVIKNLFDKKLIKFHPEDEQYKLPKEPAWPSF